MKPIEEKQKYIKDYLDYLNEDQISFLFDYMKLTGHWINKNDLRNLAGISDEKYAKIDTAYPIGYVDKVKEIFGRSDIQNLVYDYNENSFGQLVNLNDIVVKRIINSLK